MTRQYLKQNVYEAYLERMHLVFSEFENIFVSFSGGKDSGLLLNLTLDFRNKYYPGRRIGVFHQDFEAQYTVTTQYVEQTFQRLEDDPTVELYWSACPWPLGPASAVTRCIGIHGTIRKRNYGSGRCRSIPT